MPLRSVSGNRGVPSLGLAYLTSALKADGHEVNCIDAFAEAMDDFTPIGDSHYLANGLSIPEIIKRIPSDTKMIGVSCMFSNEWVHSSELVKEIKKAFPHVFMVLGGEHVTADHNYILKTFPEVNCCVLGEGEQKIRSLAKGIEAGITNLSEIEGITFFNKETNEIVTTTVTYRIKDLSEIQPPDWNEVPLRKFLDRGMGMSTLGKRSLPMLLSRGCPYRCTFCSSEQMWTTRWTARNLDTVMDEMKKYIAEFDINHIDFYDLTAVVNRNWTISFCKRMIEEKINISWSLPSGTRSEALDQEVLHYLRASGCTKITYAPESGSVRMTKLIKKNVNLPKMLASMKIAVKEGLIVKSNIIFGFPGEKMSDIFWNFVFIFKMAWVGVHDVPCFGFTPYPGSALFNQLLNEGKIKKDENYNMFLVNLVYTSPLERVSWNEGMPSFMMPLFSLGGMAFFYSLQFLFRPWRIFILLSNVLNKKPLTMLEFAFRTMIDDYWHGRKLKTFKVPSLIQKNFGR